jgi:hypothetical protein
MDKITVAELATECLVQNQVVFSELKRLGLYVGSATATIDASFADTIRKKILAQREAEEAKVLEADKKKEAQAESAKKAERKGLPKKAAAPVRAEPVPEAPAARKAKKATKKTERTIEVKEEESILRPSLAPRKGRKHYDRVTAELIEATPAAPPRPAELTPSEVAQAFFSDVGAPVETVEEPAPAEHELEVQETPPAVEPEVPSRPEVAAKPPEPALRAADALPHPGTVSKKIVVPKARTKILMRTSTEKVVTPDMTDRILKGLPVVARTVVPSKFVRRKKPGKVEAPERVAKVVDLPRPPASP